VNCKDAQTRIAQFAEAHPAAELMAHVRTCENCRQALEEQVRHQAWLRRQFAEVSARLLAEAPLVSEAALRERLQRMPPPPSRARPLLGAALLVAVGVIAGVIVWQIKRPAGAGGPGAVATNKTATNLVARTAPKPPLPLRTVKTPAAKPKPKQKPRPPGTELPDKAELDALEMSLKPAAPPPDAAGAKPPAADAEPSTKPMPAEGVRTLTMVASSAVPAAGGLIIPAGQPGPDGTPAASTTMNLHGLAVQSPYVITGLNAAGQRIVLANIMTDATGGAVADLAAALRHVPATAGVDPAAVLQHLVVQDLAGNTILTVSSTAEPPAPTPAQPPP